MTTGARYCRVYWSVVDDPKFTTVWDDDRALATWLRLLITADMAYPSSATIPTGTQRRGLDTLVSAGLVELVGTTRYRITGLDAERQRRAGPARAAAMTRWMSVREDADAVQPHPAPDATAVLGKQSRAEEEKEQSRTHEDASADDHLDAYFRMTGSWPSPGVTRWMDDMARDHGPAAVTAALAQELTADDERRTLLSRTQTRLERAAHQRRKAGERAEQERQEREQRMMQDMPEEQRRANMDRLRQQLVASGLLGPDRGGDA